MSLSVEARLMLYQGMLERWGARINLVADGQDVARRHIADSLALEPFIGPGANVDVGSGAGFPGLVLAIVTGCRFDLVEADRRKAAFLDEAARATDAPVTVYPIRIEQYRKTNVDRVVARAFSPLPRLLELTHHLIGPTSVMLLLKGRRAQEEILAARSSWTFDDERHCSATSSESSVLVLRNVRRLAR